MGVPDIITDGLSISFPEFGKPTSASLLREAKKISPRISGPETHVVNTAEGVLTSRVFAPIELQSNKGEDRIFTGFIGNTPMMVIADEASDVVTSTGSIISGGGGKAAQEAILGSLEVFSDQLTEGLDSAGVYRAIQRGYERAAERINDHNLQGKTTLLVAFLYVHKDPQTGDGIPVWYYAAVGNGRFSLGSPSRRHTGHTTESNLLTSIEMGITPVIGAGGLPFPPEIGTRVYAPEDFLVGATDGIDGPMRAIWANQKLLLPQLVEKADPSDSSFSHRLALTFRNQRIPDDAVLGSIVTSIRK